MGGPAYPKCTWACTGGKRGGGSPAFRRIAEVLARKREPALFSAYRHSAPKPLNEIACGRKSTALALMAAIKAAAFS